jgi:hypothetical protein
MVSGLRHGADCLDEELWNIVTRWCSELIVLVDLQRAQITIVCCEVYFQPYGWTSSEFS